MLRGICVHTEERSGYVYAVRETEGKGRKKAVYKIGESWDFPEMGSAKLVVLNQTHDQILPVAEFGGGPERDHGDGDDERGVHRSGGVQEVYIGVEECRRPWRVEA